MSTAAHPLAPLLGPLRYACARDFAMLGNLRDLGGLFGRVLDNARNLPPGSLSPLRDELPNLDSTSPEKRRAAIRRVLGHLEATGLTLPLELARLSIRPAIPAAAAASKTGLEAGGPERVDGNRVRQAYPERAPHPERRPRVQTERSAAKSKSAWNIEQPSEEVPAARTPAGAGVAKAGVGKALAIQVEGAATSGALKMAARPNPDASVGTVAKPVRKPRKASTKTSAPPAPMVSAIAASGPLAVPLRSVGKINPRLQGALDKKGLRTVADLLYFIPRAYEDRRKLSTIAELRPGEKGVVVAVVRLAGDGARRGPRKTFKVVVADSTGSLQMTWFQSGNWMKARFPIGKRLLLSGEVRASLSGREMIHPEIEPADDLETSSVHFNRIVPIYPTFERWEQRGVRELAHRTLDKALNSVDDPLPDWIRQRLGLRGLSQALFELHFPRDVAGLEMLEDKTSPGHRRLAFDELFFLQLGVGLRRQRTHVAPGIATRVDPVRLETARALLPFRLTGAQERVIKEICGDLGRPEPMNRLLQGDVGSGKTAVALVSAMLALQDGHQVALMAPTEILAEQHHRTFTRLLGPAGYRVGLVTAGGTAKEKREVRAALATGEIHVGVGTHALIQQGVDFSDLSLVVVDEQHRFGVVQRQSLMSKGRRPDVLVMTATPIPRTLAMTLYGDLDVSVIDALPPGRTPIVTRVFPDNRRREVYAAINHKLCNGHVAHRGNLIAAKPCRLSLRAVSEIAMRPAITVLPASTHLGQGKSSLPSFL